MSNSESAPVAQAQPEAVFAPSPRARLSGSTVLALLASVILVFGGFYLMSLAFSFGETAGLWLFVGGLAADVIGFWLAFGWLPNRER